MSKQDKKELNPYIPKYIISKPWYNEKESGPNESSEEITDYLAHQRKTSEIVDYSLPQVGHGINDETKDGIRNASNDENYDTKRDRWFGYSTEEWLAKVKNWNEKNDIKIIHARNEADDSDDTDYELELNELGLDRKDVMQNIKEDPMEKMLRDRQDVPAYIHNINSRSDAKIRIEYDPKSRLAKDPTKGILNDKNQFVKKLEGDAKDLKTLQTFAWDLNKKNEQQRKTAQAASVDETGAKVNVTDGNDSLEATPTLMSIKEREQKEAAKQKSIAKRRKILDIYGGDKADADANANANGLK
ncbi:Slu7 protein [Candida orthopsilosis Co 90-125]|uniref:Pre-mRNA-splicing factor SLU7 n=1 Tax=Candida orthopsilosis (strain 90-125) TaxID=1136231 RepID=H8X3G6_CANO9|nr:Slu7 protein [Candida orthopsilosis Co 90-125]CCG25439.1 Slu7 protein [Candida orthopsilosis Co 90-125]